MVNVKNNGEKRRAGSGELGLPRVTVGFWGILDTFLTCEANYGAGQAFEV
jgi:hypothetical protein